MFEYKGYPLIHLLFACVLFLCASTSWGQASEKSILDRIQQPGKASVKIEMDSKLQQLFTGSKANKKLTGWRIRISRDNRQDARAQSANIMASVRASYPDTPVYQTYQAPYFYVAVGDYRSRDEAESMKRNLQIKYPGASLIESQINFPPL